jgi:hypothetical protein
MALHHQFSAVVEVMIPVTDNPLNPCSVATIELLCGGLHGGAHCHRLTPP